MTDTIDPIMTSPTHTPNNYRIDGDTSYIALTNRAGDKIDEVIVDTEDLFPLLALGRWQRERKDNYYYAVCNETVNKVRRYICMMHRAILLLTKDNHNQVDHINHNGLDNRKCNLRILTLTQNLQNSDKKYAFAALDCRNVQRSANGKWYFVEVIGTDDNGNKVKMKKTMIPTLEEAKRVASLFRMMYQPYSPENSKFATGHKGPSIGTRADYAGEMFAPASV